MADKLVIFGKSDNKCIIQTSNYFASQDIDIEII
jgi:hypothetical protein